MPRVQRFKSRNEKVRKLFDQISAKNPKWRIDAVIEDVAEEMYLSTRTIEAILRGEGVYGDNNKPKVDPNQQAFKFA